METSPDDHCVMQGRQLHARNLNVFALRAWKLNGQKEYKYNK